MALETDDIQDVNISRGYACEATALRFVNLLSEREKIDMLLYELPSPGQESRSISNPNEPSSLESPRETSPLLRHGSGTDETTAVDRTDETTPSKSDHAEHFEGLNALEIAAVSGAKRFLSSRNVQRIIDAIWKGDVVFWQNLSAHATKRAQVYQRKNTDPFSRLRVPIYLKVFEILFFAAFLFFYYAVLVQRSFHTVTVAEIFLYIWIVSFAYNEFGEFWDAGTTFYMSDFWSAWDIFIVLIGIAFFVTRKFCASLQAFSRDLNRQSFGVIAYSQASCLKKIQPAMEKLVSPGRALYLTVSLACRQAANLSACLLRSLPPALTIC